MPNTLNTRDYVNKHKNVFINHVGYAKAVEL